MLHFSETAVFAPCQSEIACAGEDRVIFRLIIFS